MTAWNRPPSGCASGSAQTLGSGLAEADRLISRRQTAHSGRRKLVELGQLLRLGTDREAGLAHQLLRLLPFRLQEVRPAEARGYKASWAYLTARERGIATPGQEPL